MNRKIFFITVIIVILAATAVVYLNLETIKRAYYFRAFNTANGTGSISSTPDPDVIKKGDSINKLQNALPINQPKFAITSYDYRKGLFLVELASPGDSAGFDAWYQTSGYASIPKSMFYFK